MSTITNVQGSGASVAPTAELSNVRNSSDEKLSNVILNSGAEMAQSLESNEPGLFMRTVTLIGNGAMNTAKAIGGAAFAAVAGTAMLVAAVAGTVFIAVGLTGFTAVAGVVASVGAAVVGTAMLGQEIVNAALSPFGIDLFGPSQEKQQAATDIQKIFRGFQGRKEAAKAKEVAHAKAELKKDNERKIDCLAGLQVLLGITPAGLSAQERNKFEKIVSSAA